MRFRPPGAPNKRSFSSIMWCTMATFVLIAGCQDRPKPVIGTALSPTFNDAVTLAIEDASKNSKDRRFNIVLLPEWSSVAATAIELATSLLSHRELVAVVGHSNSSASLAASQLYNDAKVVELAPTTTAALYSESGPFSFRMVPSDQRQGRLLALAAIEEPATKARVALLYANDDYGRSLRAITRAILDSLGAEVAIDLPHLDGVGRGPAVILDTQAVVNARPNVILWLGRSLSLSEVLPSIRSSLGEIPVIGSDAMTSWILDENNWQPLKGVLYVDFVDLNETEELRRFSARYHKRFGRFPSAGEVLSYDAMTALIAAINEGARTGTEVRKFLTELGHSRPAIRGLTGPISFNSDGEIERDLMLLRIKPPTAQFVDSLN